MVDEAIQSDNTANTKIYVRDMWFKYFRKIKKDKRINHLPDLPYKGEKKIDQPLHWGSGTYALLVAASLPDITEVRIIGFDLYDKNSKVNNIYKNTMHYAKKDDKPVDFSYWVYQAQKVFVHNPQIEFNIINAKDWQTPTQWKLPNVSSQLLTTA